MHCLQDTELDTLELEVTQAGHLKPKAEATIVARDDLLKKKVDVEKWASKVDFAKLELTTEL